ncbi:unnamed protein product [Somion occarium]|uniref:C3H1-type domain-containing protein n=1 Tax=Somion occarium TaxID=3059160 RepID=A0ABP1DBH1_9APHY
MPRYRCMWYDGEGHPIRGGCKRFASCDFVHPSEAGWDAAIPSKNKPFDGPRNPASGFPATSTNASELGKRSTPWGASSDPRKRQASGQEDSFGAGGWGSTDSDKNKTDSSWGGGGWGGTSASNDSGGWGAPPEIDFGWGVPPENDSGWGSASGWGTSAGWGEPLPATNTGGWGSPSGWRDAEKDTGKGKEKEQVPVVDNRRSGWGAPWNPLNSPKRDDALARDMVSTTGGGNGWGDPTATMAGVEEGRADHAPATTGAPPLRSPRREDPSEEDASETPIAQNEETSSKVKAPVAPLFDTVEDAHKDVDFSLFDANQLHERFTLIRSMSPSERSDVSSNASETDRKTIWNTYMGQLIRASRYYDKMQAVEKQRKFNRDLRHSKYYKGIPEDSAAYQKLVSLREEDERKYQSAKKKLYQALEALIELESPAMTVGLSEDEQAKAEETKKYLQETHEWIESIRPLAQKMKSESPALTVDSSATTPGQKRRRSFALTNDTMADLRTHIDKLTGKLDDLEEYFHSAILDHQQEQYQLQLMDRFEAASAMVDAVPTDDSDMLVLAAEEKMRPMVKRFEDRSNQLSAEMAAVRAEFEPCRATLEKGRVEQLSLLQERAELRHIVFTVYKENTQMSSTVQDQNKSIEFLKAAVAQIQSQPPPPAPPSAHDLVEELKHEVVASCRGDMKFTFEEIQKNVQVAMAENSKQAVGSVWKTMHPALVLMEQIQNFVAEEAEKVSQAQMGRAQNQSSGAGPSQSASTAPL